MKVAEILRAIDAEFPFARVEKWDRVGLLIGDENAEANRVLVAHEITDETLDAARGYDVLLTYHPLIFRALENLNFADPTARFAARCVRENLNVIAAHTALDHAPMPNALGDFLAQSLGLRNVHVLAASGRESLWKIVVFVPETALESACEAMWKAGAGDIGRYSRASFRTQGIGTFRPDENARPKVGEIGKDSAENEWRLEVIASERVRDDVVSALLESGFLRRNCPRYLSAAQYGRKLWFVSCRRNRSAKFGRLGAQSEKLFEAAERAHRACGQSKRNSARRVRAGRGREFSGQNCACRCRLSGDGRFQASRCAQSARFGRFGY